MHPVISTPFNQYYTFTDKPTSCNNNKPSIFCFPKINLDLPTILQFLMTLTKQGEKKNQGFSEILNFYSPLNPK